MVLTSFHSGAFHSTSCNKEVNPQLFENENVFVSSTVAESGQQVAAMAQFIHTAAATIVGADTVIANMTAAHAEYPVNNSSMADYYTEGKEEEDNNFLTGTELALLSRVTTAVGGFDPLSEDNIKTRPKFIPILEAKGGIDKDEQGHRRDTLPITDDIYKQESSIGKIQTGVFHFLEENAGLSTHCVMTNAALKKYLKRVAHGIIVRINPGTLSPLSTKKCDDMLRELSNAGITILSHPDVMSTLGAKDSLIKIKSLKCGMEDTEVYYTPDAFCLGFRKTIAFQPRVIKQNRGCQGECIWICKLKDENTYCGTYGESMVSLDTELVLMEAFDNHVEHHTVGEFLEFCINGRDGSTCEWTTTSNGRYFEGGIAAGTMIVDQRFLPRIVEGEVRCLMVGSELVEKVHKKTKEGGSSATLESGAIYTKYSPDHPKFAQLVKNFECDIPHIMSVFGMSDQPLPLLWIADYIYGESDEDLFVGEINCSCPGITRQLQHTPLIAKVATESVFPTTC